MPDSLARSARRGALTAMAMALAIACLGGQPLFAQGQSAESETAFNLTDRNQDGAIDLAEYRGRMVEVFYFSDRNVDGFLVIEEVPGAAADEFSAADTNGDGKLSQDEFVGHHMAGFPRADANGDGTLSRQEAGSWRP